MTNPHKIAERIVIARTATSADLKSRRCRICRTWKSLKFFPKDKNATLGYMYTCKKCHNLRTKDYYTSGAYSKWWVGYYLKNKERLKEKHKRFIINHPSYPQEQSRLKKMRNPLAIKAKNAVSNKIASGKWKRKPCSKCGKLNAQAHHPDYTKPLYVIWLCCYCHARHHAEIRWEKKFGHKKHLQSSSK